VAQAARVIEAVQRAAREAGRERPLPVHILVETHGALRHAFELASLPHVEVLDFGLMDFVSGHHGAIGAQALRSPGQFEHRLIARAKADVVAAALAAGVVPAHNVCLNLKDAGTIRGDAARAREEFGFQRMWSIHPAQVMPIVSAMQPPIEEVDDAAAILLAAQDQQWGPIQYQGELHDRATYRYFWSLLKRAHATGVPLPAAARQRFFPS
jgi:citrate lyase subunit beta/citryl-CoA lyase